MKVRGNSATRLSKATNSTKPTRQPWNQPSNQIQGPGQGPGVRNQSTGMPMMTMAQLREMQLGGKTPLSGSQTGVNGGQKGVPSGGQKGNNGAMDGVGNGVGNGVGGGQVVKGRGGTDPSSQSTTITIPEEKKHQNKVIWISKGYDGKESLEKNSVILDLSGHKLEAFNASFYHLYPKNKLNLVVALILRNNMLTSVSSMHLTEMPCLTDLDLGHNRLTGSIPPKCFPKSLERLDISGNSFDDLSGLIDCPNLQCVNASYNHLKNISSLPSKVKDLDISYNLLSNVMHLRLLSFSPSITSLRIIGNPILSTNEFCRVIVSSVLPNVEFLDDVAMPGNSIRKKSTSYNGSDLRPNSTSNQAKNGQNRHSSQSGQNGQTKNRNGQNGQNNPYLQNGNTITKKSQVKGDVVRTQAYAQKLKAQARARDELNDSIAQLAKPVTIGPQVIMALNLFH